VTTDGSLVDIEGDIYRPHRICRQRNGPELWKEMYYRSLTRRGAKTFRQAAALFAYENHWCYPDPMWPFMPVAEHDWFKLVADVPRERLVPQPGATMAASTGLTNEPDYPLFTH
jgi:hypothetical protein